MKRFKIWLEDLQPEKEKQIQEIWKQTLKALVGGIDTENAAQMSLSNITYNGRGASNDGSVFKGKQAVRKRLENAQIFAQLERSGDPELRKHIEDTRKWLDTEDPKHAANASTTISSLLQKLFGDKYFQQFIGDDFPHIDTAKAKVEPQAPSQDMGGAVPTPDNSMDMNSPQPNPNGPPMTGMMGQQPQVAPNFSTPQPTNPMPPRPAGAELGLF